MCDPEWLQVDSLSMLPGHATNSGKSAAEVFRGQSSFVYWTFDSVPSAVTKTTDPRRQVPVPVAVAVPASRSPALPATVRDEAGTG